VVVVVVVVVVVSLPPRAIATAMQRQVQRSETSKTKTEFPPVPRGGYSRFTMITYTKLTRIQPAA
jgi:hypothetical protein